MRPITPSTGRPWRRPSRHRPHGRSGEAERLKAAVINVALDAVIISDEEGRVVEFNPAAERLFERSAGEALGSYMSDLVVVPERAAGRRGPSGNILWSFGEKLLLEGRKAGGATFPAEIAVHRVTSGGRTLFAAYLRDLTAERAAAAALEAQRQQLERAERMSAMTALLSGVAHELNNPLAILVAQSTLLRDKAPNEDVARRAEKIEAAAQRAGRIVKSFLALARQHPPALEPIDLDSVMDEALELVGYGLRKAGIAVERSAGHDLPAVAGDRDLLGQVFAHLLMDAQSALLARPEGRRITIGSGMDGHAVVMTIGDNGAGFAPDRAAWIADPLATRPVGAGVGLSLCRSVLDAHAGSMSLDRAPEGGNLFRVRLPALRRPPAGAIGETAPAGLSVLVIDDEIDVAQSLAELIELFGHRVAIETEPACALERIGRDGFDLVFTDYRMPGLDGLALRRAIVERVPRLASRVVIVTGDTVVTGAGGGDHPSTEPGVVRLEKPFTAADVRALLDRAAAS